MYSNINTVRQMIMGGGKTAVISPLLCMLLSTGSKTVFQVCLRLDLETKRDV